MAIAPGAEAPVLRPAAALLVRRRRVTLILMAAVALTAMMVASSPSPEAWVLLAVVSSAALGYGAVLHRSSRVAVERQFQRLQPGRDGDLFGDLAGLSLRSDGSGERPTAMNSGTGWRQALGLARFALAYAAGWALAPGVFLLTIAVGRTPKDTAGQRWLANLQAAQLRMKQQSARTLVVSAAATAGVTGVGAATLLSGAGLASASPAAAAGLPAAMPAAVGMAAAWTGSSYTVQAGDTLSAIAARFGTSYEALAAANHLSNPNVIFPGQVLSVGSSSSGYASAGGTAGSYTVRAGDTLASIAARFGTSYGYLASINRIANPNLIFVGQVLRLSGSAPAAPSSPAPPAVTTSYTPAASGAQIAVDTALAQVGKPYMWGGAGPGAFDCSGLVMYAWRAAGVALDHYSVAQYEETSRISESQLEPGDLVFYDTGSGAEPGHVTIYIGGGRIVTADSPGTVVRVENLDWDGTPIGFGRVR